MVGGSEGAAPLSTWGETNKIGDPNLASMVTKDMGMGQRSKPIITYCYIAILGTRVLWRAGDETLDLGSQVGLGQRFAVAPSHQVSSLNWAMRNHPELDQGLKPMTWGSATEKTATIRASALGRSQRGPGQCQFALGADFGLGVYSQ